MLSDVYEFLIVLNKLIGVGIIHRISIFIFKLFQFFFKISVTGFAHF